jgi:RNA polymerase sigma-70 factor, ECF subfamily
MRGDVSMTPQPQVRLGARAQREELAEQEAALVARIAEGDRGAAVAALYDRNGRRLYWLGLRLLGDSGMAEELVQDTFVRVWRSAGRFDPERGSARTFVFTLARRAAVDLLRRPAARPLKGVTADDLETGVADEIFEQALLGLEVRDALQALTAKHREILEWYYERDLTQTQIARELGLPVGTVKTRTYYALRELRRELEECGVLD